MGSAKIMIVEDNTTVAEDCRDCLEGLGYGVTSIVASGEESIDKAETERPDVVIMDIHLRDKMDGIAAAEQIHARFGIPVVFLSAYSDSALLERAKPVGSFGYIVKPFEERELYAAIEMALYRSNAEKEREALIVELQEALEHIKTLRGIIPICSHCKKIRDDEGYWHQVEEYVDAHTEAHFSHGICPGCVRELYPDTVDEILGDDGECKTGEDL